MADGARRTYDRGVLNQSGRADARLDLVELDALAIDLDLAIEAAEKLDVAVRPHPDPVAGFIDE